MIHFPANIAQHEAYSKFAPMALPTRCGKTDKKRTVAPEKVSCKSCKSAITPKGV